MVQLSHLHMTTEKIIALTIWTFVRKVLSLLSNKSSRFVIAFLPRSKHLLILWLELLSAVILEPKKIKFVTVCTFSLFAMKWLVFWMLSFKPAFSLFSFTLIKSSLVPLCFLPLQWCHLHICYCISEVVDISPISLDSSLWVIQPSISHDVTTYSLAYSFPNPEPVCCSMSGSVAPWPASRFHRRQVGWSGSPISWRIFHSLLWSTVRGFSIVNEAVDFFSRISLLFLWSNGSWQFDLWFLCLF